MYIKGKDIKAWFNPIKKIVGDEKVAKEILTFLAMQDTKERIRRKEIQIKGIRKAQNNGTNFGRPKKTLPDNFDKICQDFQNRAITADQAARYCDMGVSTFYRKAKEKKDL